MRVIRNHLAGDRWSLSFKTTANIATTGRNSVAKGILASCTITPGCLPEIGGRHGSHCAGQSSPSFRSLRFAAV